MKTKTKRSKRYKGYEHNLQIVCADYLRLQYPNLLWTHIANERQTSPARGRRLKLMGVRSGMPDILIFDWHLAIELKTDGGRVTIQQQKILSWLNSLGWQIVVVWTFEDFKKIIDNTFEGLKNAN